MSEYPEGTDPNQMGGMVVDELSSENRSAASLLIDVFGENDVKKLFSSTWQLREEALQSIEDKIMSSRVKAKAQDIFVASTGAVRFTI